MVYLGIYGFDKGSPSKIYRGVDSNGRVCGDTNDAITKDYPYLYLTNPIYDIFKRACVASCPVWDSTTSSMSAPNCSVAANCGSNTAWDVTYNSNGNVNSGVPTSSSQVMGYDSVLVISRVCVPNPNMFTTAFQSLNSTFSSALNQGALADVINDTKNNWHWLLAAAGVALIVGFIVMCFLRCCAGCIVWLSLFGIMFLFVGLGLIFLYNAGYMSAAASYASTLGVPSITSTYNEPIGWTLIGIGCFFLIVVLCCCNRIRLAVAICKSAGAFVGSVCTIILVPIFQTAFALILWAGALVTMVYLVSSATFYVQSSTDYFTTIQNYQDPELVRFYVFVFCTLWMNAFLGAMTIFVIASACCMWYYSHAPGN